MLDKICIRALIAGKVQGVGFRYSTHKKAQALGIVGWVRNLADGRVETIVEGERTQIEVLLQWFEQGPPAAEVVRVDTDEHPLGEFRDFKILR